MREFLGKLFEPGRRYTGGIIAFVKELNGNKSAQIVHDDIPVQILVIFGNFSKPKRPNLKVVMEKGIKLSFNVEIDEKIEGLIAKDIEFEL